MPRNFSGSGQYYEYNGAQITTTPLTIAAWFNYDTYDGTYGNSIAGFWDASSGGDGFVLYISTGGVLQAIALSAGTGYASNATISANTTYHGCAVFTSPTSRVIYRDGSAQTPNTTSITPSGLDRTIVGGAAYVGIHAGYFDGDIGDVGIWNVALGADEVAALAAGVTPLLVRPQSLVHYLPMDQSIIDVVGGYNFAATGSPTVSDRDWPIIHAAPVFYSIPAAAGGSTEVTKAGTITPSGAPSRHFAGARAVAGEL